MTTILYFMFISLENTKKIEKYFPVACKFKNQLVPTLSKIIKRSQTELVHEIKLFCEIK